MKAQQINKPKSGEATEPSACIIDFGMARAFDVLDHDNDLAAHLMESFSEVYLLGQSKEVELVCWNVLGFKSWVVTISINQ